MMIALDNIRRIPRGHGFKQLAGRDQLPSFERDYTVRMKEYFDHYLMDKPAPKWMTEGVPQVKKGGPIQ